MEWRHTAEQAPIVSFFPREQVTALRTNSGVAANLPCASFILLFHNDPARLALLPNAADGKVGLTETR